MSGLRCLFGPMSDANGIHVHSSTHAKNTFYFSVLSICSAIGARLLFFDLHRPPAQDFPVCQLVFFRLRAKTVASVVVHLFNTLFCNSFEWGFQRPIRRGMLLRAGSPGHTIRCPFSGAQR